ncbi:MAG TPA: ParB/RepB/Spo0J family partition protein [Gemmatimonadaceae bacterium]|nr:ParB/RepB/Spo0J family partition protein [Gemmatimonadaceae bacterium]
MSAEKPRRLGRGLEALIGSQAATATASELQRIPVIRVRANPYQPRREFDAQELTDLETSIKVSGLLQPITVRRTGELYELIAGERRLRAVTNLGWRDVPAIVRDLDDQAMLVLALVENLQRSDLNPIEEARGYSRLLEEFELTHQQVADLVGKDRTTVTNLLRILSLPAEIQRFVEEGVLSVGHARAILGLEENAAMLELANEVVARGLNVRATEQRARAGRSLKSREARRGKRPTPEDGASPYRDPAVARIQDDLRRYLQTDVTVNLSGAEKGTIRLSFYSPEDLERLLDLILRDRRSDF